MENVQISESKWVKLYNKADSVNRKIRGIVISNTKNSKIYLYLYKSYWYMLLNKRKKKTSNYELYLTAIPNRGAGIGHQIANWIAGYWWAKKFDLNFAHTMFSTAQWEKVLGFGEDEVNVNQLKDAGYKQIRLPLFDEENDKSIKLTKEIIQSYRGKKVYFVCEQDQGYRDQYGVMSEIQQKFYKANARKNENIIYSSSDYNIALHVRRGDIMHDMSNKNLNLILRWQSHNYFINVLENVSKILTTEKPVKFFLFSQGIEEEFEEYRKYPNLKLCLDMNAYESFIHMVYADLLITSKSSFSYKPALLNRGLKVCPKDFWHGYPNTKDWILVDNEGNFTLTN